MTNELVLSLLEGCMDFQLGLPPLEYLPSPPQINMIGFVV